MSKLEELINKERFENFMSEHKTKKACRVLLTVGIMAAIIAALYFMYRYFVQNDFNEDEDDYDDDFDDDFFDDEE